MTKTLFIGEWFKPASVTFTVLGQIYSLKNSKQARRNGFPVKHHKARRFEEMFFLQVPQKYRNLKMGSPKEPLRAVVTAYFPSFRQDVDVEIIWDCLQNAGVVSNDRHIREKHIYGEVDPKNPRVEIILEPL